jgi:penicillin amidase
VNRASTWLARIVFAAALIAAAGGLAAYLALRASLPREEGEVSLAGLGAAVQIERDALGIPSVSGETFEDVARAQGFLHAQERFFQLDLARRFLAGELAELLGPAALPADRQMRPFLHRRKADRLLASVSPIDLRVLEAYAAGVNAGLEDLGARPPEYWLLQSPPAPWKAEDSVLVMASFFGMLSIDRKVEPPLIAMRETLPPELYAFLTPETTRFDAPLIRSADGSTGYEPLPIPGPEIVDLRTRAPVRLKRKLVTRPFRRPGGSNNWAVSGARSAHGGAILANDPHLQLSVPGTWYRIELHWAGRSARGVSAPGIPGVVIGATDHLAWGFTNGFADHDDLILIEVDASDASRYRAPGGYESFRELDEVIRLGNGDEEALTVRQTRWGPIVAEDLFGRPLVLRSTADDPLSRSLLSEGLLVAESIEEGIRAVRRMGGPSQNVLLADRKGRIAWVLSGDFPKRVGFDGKAPVSWADGSMRWDGLLDESRRPLVVDPPDGALFTANGRTIPADAGRDIAHAWAPSFRSARIAELIQGDAVLDERSMLAMQLDTRSRLHDTVQQIILSLVAEEDQDPSLQRVRALVQRWNGTADADQAPFRLLSEYHDALREAVIAPLLLPCLEADPEFRYNWLTVDEPFMQILDERPPHLVPPGHASWQDFLLDTLRTTVERIEGDPSTPPLDAPWGEANRAAIQHPLARALPALSGLLNMPEDPMPGYRSTLRVHVPGAGASMRMVVSPGHEETAILHMPGGQSGHFLSPHYADAHAAWVEGEPSPFLSGPKVSELKLVPAR